MTVYRRLTIYRGPMEVKPSISGGRKTTSAVGWGPFQAVSNAMKANHPVPQKDPWGLFGGLGGVFVEQSHDLLSRGGPLAVVVLVARIDS